jgi:BlaI family transcriptional regulator, penicillinase repressor
LARTRTDVPDAELAVLKVLWDRGGSTIREITDVLYPDGGASYYATVQKLLERLGDREFVARNADGRAHVFSAKVQREDLIRHRLRDAADRLCEGSMTPLLTQLVKGGKLDAAELGELRRLVDELDDDPKGGGR